MHLIDVSNSYSRRIQRELTHSDTHFIKIYTLGNTRVVFKKKANNEEIVLSNKTREVTNEEVDLVLKKLTNATRTSSEITRTKNTVDIQLR
ncbi:DUF1827 family protein [Liquorilactobacillus oeni]|uniref:DUF1827 family protein n=1 Tax=Liquorilactobacillus oeni TaxID=303241 RepID=UPI000708E651|nr:DUF1827 family protein [Liquorilactobacillus oeni]